MSASDKLIEILKNHGVRLHDSVVREIVAAWDDEGKFSYSCGHNAGRYEGYHIAKAKVEELRSIIGRIERVLHNVAN